jgi:ribose transport system substrate-binding protein
MATLAAAIVLSLAGCSTDEPVTGPSGGPSTAGTGTGEQSKFFVQADYESELAMLEATATGPADKPWEQALNPSMVETTSFRKAGPHKICFSNAGLNNPWRQVGFKTMQAEV